MSRNLCTSTCPECDEHTVRLTDILGKPLEARRYGPYAPSFGTRWDCPCGRAYFVIIRTQDRFWPDAPGGGGADPAVVYAEETTFGDKAWPNPQRGRFVRETTHPLTGQTHLEQTGHFVLDLSYYESYNDEPGPDPDERRHLVTDDCADVQLVW